MGDKTALVVVAHPDDESLWMGGTILAHPRWHWTVLSLCRGSDPDRAPKFKRVAGRLGAAAIIGDLDDGPDQDPLPAADVEAAVSGLLPGRHWDIVYSHSPFGEYTRHRRHEEVGRAVTALWRTGDIVAKELVLFAYEDNGRRYLPRPIEGAHSVFELNDHVWRDKRTLITDLYGFEPGSWEADAVPRVEAFWRFKNPGEFDAWLAAQQNSPAGGQQ